MSPVQTLDDRGSFTSYMALNQMPERRSYVRPNNFQPGEHRHCRFCETPSLEIALRLVPEFRKHSRRQYRERTPPHQCAATMAVATIVHRMN